MAEKKIIINFCPTGMVPTKAMNPNVPVSVQEIVEQTHEAWELGITIAHLHARHPDQTPAWEPEIYRDIFEGVRRHCPGLVICGSTSGRSVQDFERRSAVIELRPDMCSLTLSSLNFMNEASINAPDMIQRLASKMNDYGVKPELECFHLGMINYGNYLIRKGLIKGPFYWNLLYGNIAGFQANFRHYGTAVTEIDPKDSWIAFGGLGDSQLDVLSIAVAHGFGVRVGLEDNLWFDRQRKVPASNLSLLRRVHAMLALNDRELMPASEFGRQGFYNPFNHAVEG